jgi:hypothetical protein
MKFGVCSHLLIISFVGFLASACLGPSNDENAPSRGTRNTTDFSYWTLDRTQQITSGNESWAVSANEIFQCANDPDGNPLICYQTCISRWFPRNRRYSLYLSGYVPNNRCFVSVLESPSHDGEPAGYEYFEGSYETYSSGGTLRSRCAGIDEAVPELEALHAFSTYTTPTGQMTSNPWGYRSYDLLTLFDSSGRIVISSMYLQTWQTTEGALVNPSRYSLFEANTSGNEITLTRMNGFECAKRSEITNNVILSFQVGQ